jgi:hypothetical protein
LARDRGFDVVVAGRRLSLFSICFVFVLFFVAFILVPAAGSEQTQPAAWPRSPHRSIFSKRKEREKEKMDSGSNDHEGIWETDFKIDYKDLNFEGEVAEGAFGKIYKGDYFGTPVAIKKYSSSPFLVVVVVVVGQTSTPSSFYLSLLFLIILFIFIYLLHSKWLFNFNFQLRVAQTGS